ncbi:hypothetical protein CR513_14797, partial [Mucuna pruriens]
MLEVSIREGKRISLKKETLCGKDRFPHIKKSKLLSRRDGLFKILRKINENAYKVDITPNFGGSTTFNVIDLTPCDTGANSLQEGLDDAYTKRTYPTLEGPITR